MTSIYDRSSVVIIVFPFLASLNAATIFDDKEATFGSYTFTQMVQGSRIVVTDTPRGNYWSHEDNNHCQSTAYMVPPSGEHAQTNYEIC